jgi:hypothetical protein
MLFSVCTDTVMVTAGRNGAAAGTLQRCQYFQGEYDEAKMTVKIEPARDGLPFKLEHDSQSGTVAYFVPTNYGGHPAVHEGACAQKAKAKGTLFTQHISRPLTIARAFL